MVQVVRPATAQGVTILQAVVDLEQRVVTLQQEKVKLEEEIKRIRVTSNRAKRESDVPIIYKLVSGAEVGRRDAVMVLEGDGEVLLSSERDEVTIHQNLDGAYLRGDYKVAGDLILYTPKDGRYTGESLLTFAEYCLVGLVRAGFMQQRFEEWPKEVK